MSVSLRFNPAALMGFAPAAPASVRKAARAAAPSRRESPDAAALPRASGTYPTRPVAGEGGIDVPRLLAAARTAPELPMLEWDGDLPRARTAAAPSAPAPAEAMADEDPHAFEPKRRRLRDRYVAARFPGVARNAGELQNVTHAVKAARLMFEEEQSDLALELLELAIEESPQESALRLARLEILFLARDRGRFVEGARAFRDAHPFHEAWEEVARLGRAIAPDEPLFGDAQGPREHEHYGPWPHLPNWIQAPWDLTAEVLAADFRRGLCKAAAPSA